MATIQVRDISQEAYEIIRSRARRSGRSLQAYMREEIERLARTPTDTDLLVQIESFVAEQGIEVDREVLLSDLDADRR